MLYRGKPDQVSYGEAIGIILLENYVPFIPGDVANATSYNFPVRFQRVPGFTVERIFAHDMSLVDALVRAALDLEGNGVRAITGDCGFMALYQNAIKAAVSVPVCMSSLSQIAFMRTMLGKGEKIGIITANSESLDDQVLGAAGIVPGPDLVIAGLEKADHFVSAVFREEGELDSERIKAEVVAVAKAMTRSHTDIGLILLECSLLPPYAAAVRESTGLPVFDYLTMIRQLYDAVVPRSYSGYL
ncbi:aspartate/glutamate racemase family protein [Sediminispirochaeta smaragdinae]|uniref:Aspartate/glutamate racemase family protein n=1 Tax=Sediminispirochaeta smaragdinae (strain DSM 11293 / JCM 15392 / SEBR 4228) TaxID=573413 RepID=E1RBI4_SEDSS|nr:aspartate/glutamate racemase family protein [Sediminispirochaeta smaragdinae]ADK79714.1 conserved hypothetical protein [Sediminispirochaeta smaragdinae DSM 11293]